MTPSTILVSQNQAQITQHPQLDLVIENPQDNTQILRTSALVDTGFQGYVLINQRVAKNLKLKRLQGVVQRIKNADEKVSENKIVLAWVEFLSLEAASPRCKIPCVIKEMQDECVLGSKMLEKFAKDNKAHLLFNYLQDKIQFVSA